MTTNNSANQSSIGIQSLTSAGIFNGRTITGTANQIGVSNGDGTAGNPTLSLTSTIYVSGISFDSGSNTLSAYSTGTWTPTFTGSGSNPTVTYSQQQGFYEVVGSRCIALSNIVLTAYSGGTGDLQISGYPFTSSSTANSDSAGECVLSNITFQASVLWYNAAITTNSSVSVFIGSLNNASYVTNVVTNLSATSNPRVLLVYNI